MNWSDEVKLSRMPDADAGMLCKIRLTFKGSFSGLKTDADDIFGPGWMERAERLRRTGSLKVSTDGRTITMTAVAPGDRKRKSVRQANRKYRAKKGNS